MADCIWMETALIASSLAEHRDMACSWVRKQGAIERDLSNETTYQELVEELQLRPLEARRLAVFFCSRVAEVKQQPVLQHLKRPVKSAGVRRRARTDPTRQP